MDDLVTRLRGRYMDTKQMLPCPLEHEAADEIERLQAELAALREYLEQHAPLTLRGFNTTNLTMD